MLTVAIYLEESGKDFTLLLVIFHDYIFFYTEHILLSLSVRGNLLNTNN